MTLDTWSFPTPITIGPGAVRELPRLAVEAGIQRPLLITDPGLKDLAPMEAVREQFPGAPVHADVHPNPLDSDVARAIEVLRDGGHDGVIAVGGGSAMDCAKAAAFMIAQSRSLWHFDDNGPGWRDATTAGLLPLIAVPTTAGTGSEVGRAVVIGSREQGFKKILFHPRMMPVAVVLDPVLTAGLPRGLTAATGFDALAHALEAYCVDRFHPFADGMALEAIRLIHGNLERVCEDGQDLVARQAMLAAAAAAATAFQKGLGAMHTISHGVGALFNTHHGRTNAVVMPYVLAFNRPAIEGKLETIARLLDLDGGASGVMAWVMGLRERLGIEPDLAALGVAELPVERLVALGLADPTCPCNPVRLSADTLGPLIQACHSGDLAAAAGLTA